MTEATSTPTTTNAGILVESDEHSLTIGPDGPILLHDHYLIEQLAQFNRERVPERQPHAKGSGAFGRFAVFERLRRELRQRPSVVGAVDLRRFKRRRTVLSTDNMGRDMA